jgi:hypothetical protein
MTSNEDVRRTLEEQAAAKAGEATARAELASNWRRLLLYRAGLAQELARMLEGRLEEDAEVLFEKKLSAQTRGPTPAEALEEARRLHVEHQAAGLMARMSPSWHKQAAVLSEAFETARDGLQERERTLQFQRDMLKRAADAEVAANRRANARAMAPHAAHRARLAAVDMALGVLRRGDKEVSECLRRWDLEALLKVADIRRKLDLYGSVSAPEWSLYCSAGIPAIVPPMLGPGLMDPAMNMGDVPRHAAVDEGSAVRIRMDPSGAVSGTLIRAFGGLSEGVDLAGLGAVRLAELLGRFHMDGLARDADLLEAYLESTLPNWRERVAETMDQTASSTSSAAAPKESPYDVLGVTEGMPMAEIARTFMEQMQVVGKLPNGAPQRRLVDAFKAIRAVNPVSKETACP